MVRVFYEPPPYGPGTDLNRTAYGIGGGGTGAKMMERLSKMRPVVPLTAGVLIAMAVSYIPVMGQKLPFSMDPEYKAAERAYMRYHNMNPIFGISSKRARAMDPDP